LFLAAIPFLSPTHRSLGVLFIPAFVVLTNGSILFIASLFNLWNVWTFLWPLEVLSVAAGFLFAALYTRWVWLAIPAILIGANGFVLAFCNTTGLWSWWSVLWTVEPLALGVSLLVIAIKTRLKAIGVVGLLFCAFAGIMASMMASIFLSAWRLFSFFWPVALIVTGFTLLVLGFSRNFLPPHEAAPSTPAGSTPASASGS
jgi:hypothetical protein